MCSKVKIDQILDIGLRWPLTHILQDPYSSVKTSPEKLVYMLCCLFASLTRLQNETFNCLKHGFLNSWNSSISVCFFSYLWNGKWYQNESFVKMILDSCRIHWHQNHKLALWQHQPHLLVLGHDQIYIFKDVWSSGTVQDTKVLDYKLKPCCDQCVCVVYNQSRVGEGSRGNVLQPLPFLTPLPNWKGKKRNIPKTIVTQHKQIEADVGKKPFGIRLTYVQQGQNLSNSW